MFDTLLNTVSSGSPRETAEKVNSYDYLYFRLIIATESAAVFHAGQEQCRPAGAGRQLRTFCHVRRRPSPVTRFSLTELAGSLGDFGTIIPLILAVALVSDVNVRYILLFFGIWFILTGVLYQLPIPLEPMKAVAVIVIAGNIGKGEIAAAGLVLGVIFLVLARFLSSPQVLSLIAVGVLGALPAAVANVRRPAGR